MGNKLIYERFQNPLKQLQRMKATKSVVSIVQLSIIMSRVDGLSFQSKPDILRVNYIYI